MINAQKFMCADSIFFSRVVHADLRYIVPKLFCKELHIALLHHSVSGIAKNKSCICCAPKDKNAIFYSFSTTFKVILSDVLVSTEKRVEMC